MERCIVNILHVDEIKYLGIVQPSNCLQMTNRIDVR